MSTCTLMMRRSVSCKAAREIDSAYVEHSALLLGCALTAGKISVDTE